MVRAIRIDTEGHILEKETEYLYLKGEVVDRDYVNSTANSALTKTIKYAFSYNLRSRNPYLLWLFNGDDHGEITYETYETYVK